MRDDYERFTTLGAEVLAISAESPARSEAYLRSHLEQVTRPGDEIETKRTQLPDGTELVELDLQRSDGRVIDGSLETGHARIAELLRDR